MVWSASFLLMKRAVLAFGPLSVGCVRLAGGLAVLGLILTLWKKARWRPAWADLPLLLLICLIGYILPFCLQPWLISRHGGAWMAVICALNPLWTVLFSLPLLGIRPSLRQLVGVLGGFGLIVVLAWDGLSLAIPPLHALLAVAVPAGYALGNVLIRRRFTQIPAIGLSAVALAIALAMGLPFALMEPVHRGPHLATALVAALILGVIGTGLAGSAFYALVLSRGPLYAGMSSYLFPLGALAIGWGDGEPVTVLQAVVAIGILGMVALVQSGREKT